MSLQVTEYRMTRSIQQIKQDLDTIELTVAETAEELQNLYNSYLNLLSQSVNQQLIRASYQLCTEFYPQSFLNLSLSNKQNLQQKLREIGQKLQPVLLEIIEQKELNSDEGELNLVAELIKNLPNLQKSENDEEKNENEARINLELVKAELENIELTKINASLASNPDTEDSESQTPANKNQKIDFKNPEHLILWHKQIEGTVKKILDSTSKEINKCLQESKIIPSRLPTKIMDVAIKTDSGNKGRNNHKLQHVPNILNLAIETDKDKQNKPASIAQISVLRLRLAEIEFSDHLLNAQRSQIRTVMSKISKLRHKYQAVKQERDVAEAQAAWRSSWYED